MTFLSAKSFDEGQWMVYAIYSVIVVIITIDVALMMIIIIIVTMLSIIAMDNSNCQLDSFKLLFLMKRMPMKIVVSIQRDPLPPCGACGGVCDVIIPLSGPISVPFISIS